MHESLLNAILIDLVKRDMNRQGMSMFSTTEQPYTLPVVMRVASNHFVFVFFCIEIFHSLEDVATTRITN
jgi:hypothetical protein